jgi:hypothetical protein
MQTTITASAKAIISHLGENALWFFDVHGYIIGQREVEHYEDGTTRVGGQLFMTRDLTIEDGRITGPGGWYLTA